MGWSVVQFSFIFLIGSPFGQAGARRDGRGRACGGFGLPLVDFGVIWGRFLLDFHMIFSAVSSIFVSLVAFQPVLKTLKKHRKNNAFSCDLSTSGDADMIKINAKSELKFV